MKSRPRRRRQRSVASTKPEHKVETPSGCCNQKSAPVIELFASEDRTHNADLELVQNLCLHVVRRLDGQHRLLLVNITALAESASILGSTVRIAAYRRAHCFVEGRCGQNVKPPGSNLINGSDEAAEDTHRIEGVLPTQVACLHLSAFSLPVYCHRFALLGPLRTRSCGSGT